MNSWDIRQRLQRIEAELMALVNLPKTLERIETDIVRIELKIDAQSKLLAQLWTLLTGSGVPDDLQLLIAGLPASQTGKDSEMAKTCKAQLQPKGGGKAKAVMQPIVLTPDMSNIELVTVDANGQPVPGINPGAVSTTVTADNPAALTITPGPDSLHYKFTVPANTPAASVVNVSATLTFNSGTPGPFDASIQVTTPTPPPPTPQDLTITIS